MQPVEIFFHFLELDKSKNFLARNVLHKRSPSNSNSVSVNWCDNAYLPCKHKNISMGMWSWHPKRWDFQTLFCFKWISVYLHCLVVVLCGLQEIRRTNNAAVSTHLSHSSCELHGAGTNAHSSSATNILEKKVGLALLRSVLEAGLVFICDIVHREAN